MSNLYIKKFVDRLQHFELRGAQEFSCSIQDAKMLHTEITRMLLELEDLKQHPESTDQIVTLEVQGGSF